MQFPHEKLTVYQKALEFFGDTQGFMVTWSKRHAFVDHLLRASESILFNLVEAVRLRHGKKKELMMDYAIGSVLECAACLDIAALKGLVARMIAVEKKGVLLELCKMLVGLRNSWHASHLAESTSEAYETGRRSERRDAVFYHETLDRYVVALDFYRWLVSTEAGKRLRDAFERSADTLATGMLLNIAESNGRYAELSRESFLDTANAAAAKLATALDMGVRRGIWGATEAERGKALLVRVGQMTARKDYGDRCSG